MGQAHEKEIVQDTLHVLLLPSLLPQNRGHPSMSQHRQNMFRTRPDPAPARDPSPPPPHHQKMLCVFSSAAVVAGGKSCRGRWEEFAPGFTGHRRRRSASTPCAKAKASPPGSPRADWTCKLCAGKDGEPFRNYGFREICLLCGTGKRTCLLVAVAKSSKPTQRAPSEGSSQRRRTKHHLAQQAVQAEGAQLLQEDEGQEISTLRAELAALETVTGGGGNRGGEIQALGHPAGASPARCIGLGPAAGAGQEAGGESSSPWSRHQPSGSPQRRAGGAGGNNSATASGHRGPAEREGSSGGSAGCRELCRRRHVGGRPGQASVPGIGWRQCRAGRTGGVIGSRPAKSRTVAERLQRQRPQLLTPAGQDPA